KIVVAGSTVASVAITAAGTTGELAGTLATPLLVSTGVSYQVVCDDTATAAFRVPWTVGGATASSTVGNITRIANSGVHVAANIEFTDIEVVTAPAAGSAAPPPQVVTRITRFRSSLY